MIYDSPAYFDSQALSANAGNVIHGDAGNDDITIDIGDTDGANPASNTAYGDDGNDSLLFQLSARAYADADWSGASPTGTVSLYGGAGNDIASVRGYYVGGMAGMTVHQYGGAGDDRLLATTDEFDPDGSVRGGSNIDRLYGGAGNDAYVVIEGKDIVVEEAGQGTDTVVAYEIDYTLPANVENLQMSGGYYPSGPFRGTGNASANVISVDDIRAYDGVSAYILEGMGGADRISGYALGGDDTIRGGDGNDTLYGRAGGFGEGYYSDADTIYGGTGDDAIYGGGDVDTWDSDDKLYGEDGNDRMLGSFGNDLVYGGTGNDQLGGQAGNDTLHGDAGADALYGDAGNDTMSGGAGEDRLIGGPGDDTMRGGSGADTLLGREGVDALYGEGGNDKFDFDYLADSRPGALHDVIYDFSGVGGFSRTDHIDLSTLDANTSTSGNGTFAFVGTSSFTAPGQLRVTPVSGTSDTLVQANVTGTSGAALEILVKDGAVEPTAWNTLDFIL